MVKILLSDEDYKNLVDLLRYDENYTIEKARELIGRNIRAKDWAIRRLEMIKKLRDKIQSGLIDGSDKD